MTRASRRRQRRARERAARMQAVVVGDDVGRGPLSHDELIQTDIMDNNVGRGLLSQDGLEHLINYLRAAPISTEEEMELMGEIEMIDHLLDNPYLNDIERNDLLKERAECEDQLELLFQQNEELQQWRSQRDDYYPQHYQDEVQEYINNLQLDDQQLEEQFDDISEYIPQSHEDYLRELGLTEQEIEEQFDDISEYIPQSHEDYLRRELGFTEQEIEEQFREISEFEDLQQGERQSVTTEQRLTQMSSRPVDRPSNQHQSSKGHILNPNQLAGADDSPNTLFTSSGCPTSILSADFGDDDVLPIEETSCVICHVDYQHGDDVSRNANCYRSANTHGNRSTSTVATCNHVFHTNCITSWIEGSGKSDCPCCRRPFALTVPT